jgi:hypothetical protein
MGTSQDAAHDVVLNSAEVMPSRVRGPMRGVPTVARRPHLPPKRLRRCRSVRIVVPPSGPSERFLPDSSNVWLVDPSHRTRALRASLLALARKQTGKQSGVKHNSGT